MGTWRLLDYTFFHDDGREEKPWGTDVTGYLFYSVEGYMSGNLSPARRTWRSRLRRLTAEVPGAAEKAEARLHVRGIPRDYIAYSGRFTVDGDKVTHHVEVSLFPNWVGQAEVRQYVFAGNRLILRTLPLRKGRSTIVAQLTWERVLPAPQTKTI
ncbi:lipocalin-like domain-containing protein [Paracidobacterium acidisoli]|uniref:lipocalin-like domain-containing protein n=1 Tax=Paracidobacterium acidisoli TaxID=2303751 RepID=UPI001314122F|nr:lipocalin-like domain-containing protein [Paracidobacterium acidisoli]